MTTSQNMIDQIKRFEGFRANAYRDSGGVWTVGYGTTRINGQRVNALVSVTEETAEICLRNDLSAAEREVNALPNIANITQSMFDACVDFCYNCGTGSFRKSTLRKKIVSNPYDPTISKEFIRWKYATIGGVKQELAGLLKRRSIEAAWYFYGVDWSNRINDVVLWAKT